MSRGEASVFDTRSVQDPPRLPGRCATTSGAPEDNLVHSLPVQLGFDTLISHLLSVEREKAKAQSRRVWVETLVCLTSLCGGSRDEASGARCCCAA